MNPSLYVRDRYVHQIENAIPSQITFDEITANCWSDDLCSPASEELHYSAGMVWTRVRLVSVVWCTIILPK